VFRVERLTPDHDIDQFASGNGDLDSWLQGAALRVERRRTDPEFKRRLRRIIEEDRKLLERLSK
jgi:hypothetical protein